MRFQTITLFTSIPIYFVAPNQVILFLASTILQEIMTLSSISCKTEITEQFHPYPTAVCSNFSVIRMQHLGRLVNSRPLNKCLATVNHGDVQPWIICSCSATFLGVWYQTSGLYISHLGSFGDHELTFLAVVFAVKKKKKDQPDSARSAIH